MWPSELGVLHCVQGRYNDLVLLFKGYLRFDRITVLFLIKVQGG